MTRGQRNNNPLNIRHSADRWQGARGEQTDKSFVQFESMAYGYRAVWKTLESYWKHFHRTQGTACRKQHAGVHPHGAPPYQFGGQRAPAATLAWGGCLATGVSDSRHDGGGVRRRIQGCGYAGHPRWVQTGIPRQAFAGTHAARRGSCGSRGRRLMDVGRVCRLVKKKRVPKAPFFLICHKACLSSHHAPYA